MGYVARRLGDPFCYPAWSEVNHLSALNPKKWPLLCWIPILFWLSIGVLSNIPREPPLDELGAVSVLTGFPVFYLSSHHKKTGNVITVTNDASYACGILNAVLIIATLSSIVFIAQTWFRRFTISSMLVGTLVIAIVLGIAISLEKSIDSSGSAQRFHYFTIAVYLSPIVAAILTVIFNKLKLARKREITKR